MEPGAAIAIIETDLRHLGRSILSAGSTSDWVAASVSPETLAKLEARRAEEEKRRAPAAVPRDLAAYTHLYELRHIIESNWQKFQPALGAKRDFVVLMDKVEDFRNAPAHSRELLPYERALLEGIAGTVRTQVTTFVSTMAPDLKHYPVIESIRDSFGNEASSEALRDTQMCIVSSKLTLQMGTEIEIQARGWDPQGRELKWVYGSNTQMSEVTTSGSEVTLKRTMSAEDVGVLATFAVRMSSSGPYHRHKLYDHHVVFTYAVEPPTTG